jgi:alkanesulfonate monooxygenase SsuD/methylene tetrahydromethanopterin reductase-like flavin-dependent oxidoreductase (luciferase family)
VQHILVGVFVVPDAADPARTLAQIEAADAGGLDLVGVQDHPYQRRFLDTWTLLSYAAARTRRVRLVPDVANLPLRPPAVLAKAAASLDLLSEGRVELGLGAGAFWEGIAALGGPVRAPGESVDALVEAIGVIRAMWSGERSVRVDGRHYRLQGAHPGPVPAHPIGIWLGAYRPRMLRVTGRLADGWLPSVPRLPLEDVPARQAAVDEAARAAGREPSAVLRVANVGSELAGVDALARLVTDLRFQGLLLSPQGDDPVDGVRRIAEDVAPALRARLAGG